MFNKNQNNGQANRNSIQSFTSTESWFQKEQKNELDQTESNGLQVCQHMKKIQPFKEPVILNVNFQQAIEEQSLKCIYCAVQGTKIFLCLYPGCQQTICQTHLIKHHKENKLQDFQQHNILINVYSTQIQCLECETEIFDFEQLDVTGNEPEFQNYPNPKRIRELFLPQNENSPNFSSLTKNLSKNNNLQQLLISNLSIPQAHWKTNRGLTGIQNISNTSAINCIIQIFSNIPVIRKIFKKLKQKYEIYEDQVPKQPKKRLCFQIQKLLEIIWTGSQKVIRPNEIISTIYEVSPSFKGYNFQDAYEVYKMFIHVFHEELKYINQKIYDMKKGPIISNDIQDEWQVIQEYANYTEYSPISSVFKGKLCASITCLQCQVKYLCEEDFLGIQLNIVKDNERDPSKLVHYGVKTENNLNSDEKLEKNKNSGYSKFGIFQKIFNLGAKNDSQNIPTLDIYECLINFFEQKIESESPSFFCDKCNQSVLTEKRYNFLSMPNILCLTLERFKSDFKNTTSVIFPIEELLNLKPFMKKLVQYDQNFYEYEFLGMVEHYSQKGGDFYRTLIKNEKTGLFYNFSDSELKIVSLKELKSQFTQPYILFYKLVKSVNQSVQQVQQQQVGNPKNLNNSFSVGNKQSQRNNTSYSNSQSSSDLRFNLNLGVQDSLIRNLISQVKLIKNKEMILPDDQLAYLPCFWYQKLVGSCNPGMIATSHLLCKHQMLKPDYFDCFPPKFQLSGEKKKQRKLSQILEENSILEGSMVIDFESNQEKCETSYALENIKSQSEIVPISIVGYLVENFGGGPIIPCDLEICLDCILFARQIRKRRKLEKEFILKYEKKNTLDQFLIEEQWVQIWSEYLFQNKKFFKNNFIKGLPLPGPINNKKLISKNNTLLPNLKKNEHFRIFNEYVWIILKTLYTAQPVLVVSDPKSAKKDIPRPQFSQNEMQLLQEMKELVDENKFAQTRDEYYQTLQYTKTTTNRNSQNNDEKKTTNHLKNINNKDSQHFNSNSQNQEKNIHNHLSLIPNPFIQLDNIKLDKQIK